jgi:outer membrane receptor protein involved in Fe transport
MRTQACVSRLAVLFISLVVLVSSPLLAQKITGDISGDIADTSGAVIPNATVTAKNLGTDLTRTATTTGSGSYRIPDLPVGNYSVSVQATGFKTMKRQVGVAANAVIHADFKMQVGSREETVTVEGVAPMVDLSSNNNNYVDQEKIETVPLNGRDFNSLLAITPGVQRAPGGGFLAISINGSRTTSNNYFIDGLYNNDRYYGDSAVNQTGVVGIPATIFPPEAIEELTVQETPSAEFGVKGGAPIMLGMKSGTNDWHGSATWVRHTNFADAANYFSKHNTDNCGSPGECQSTPLHNNQFGGTIGGPIIKDKAFMFLYYEGQRYTSLAVSSRTVPSPQDIQGAMADIAAHPGLSISPAGQKLLSYFPTSPTETFVAQTPTRASANGFGTKFDFRLNNKHSFTARYILGDSLQSAPPFAGLPAGGSNPALFNSIAPSRAQMAGISWTWTISNNKILESRLGLTRFAQIIDVNNKIDPKSLGVDTGPLSTADFGVPYVYLSPLGYGGYVGGVQGYPITTRPDQTWDWSEHFSWVKGNHTIKFGGNYQRAYTNSLRNRARTGLVFGYFLGYAGSISGNPIQDTVEQLLLGRADDANRNFGDTHRHIYQKSVGFYGQDDWKVTPRLTLTYGLRWDINGALSESDNIGSNFFPDRGLVQLGQGIDRLYNLDLHDLGPRAGFAWDIFGSGKTALRGGYSLTYDTPNFAAFAAPYTFARARAGSFSQPFLGQFSSTSVAVDGDVGLGNTTVLPNDPAATCLDPNNLAAGGDYVCIDKGPIFGNNPSGTPPYNAFSIVNNFKTPRMHNFNLSLQQEINANNVITVGYSGQRGRDLVMYRDLNASPLGSAGDFTDRPFSTLYPDLNHIIQATNAAKSQYDSLQMTLNQRNWHGLDTQYNFTWSKCYDMNSVNRGGAGDYPQLNNPFTPRDSWGLCDHDVRLNFNVGGVYAVPSIPQLGQRLGRGWEISTIYTAISGRPFTALLSGSDPSGQGLTGSSIRAAWDGTPIHYNTRNPDQYVVETFTAAGQPDPCGDTSGGLPLSPFYFPCAGTVGNSRRNQLIGPGLSQWDMTLIKNTKITERLNFQFRWEVYNILNRANFYYFPDNTLGSTFGQLTKTSDVAVGNPVIAQGGPRNMNFAVKFTF